MYYLVLVLAAAALAGGAGVNPHVKMLAELDNHIQTDAVPVSRSRPFITLRKRPAARNAHQPGTTLELSCEAIAAPAPSVHWFKNDAPIYEYDKESNEVIDSNPTSLARVSSTLLVSRTDAPTQYTCLIMAGPGKVRATTLVYSTDGSTDTSERSKLVPLAPRVLVSYKVFVDIMGANVVLPCRVRGHPRPNVTWRTNNGVDVTNDPRMKVLRSGALVITPLTWSDMGEFTCRASNLFGTTEVKTFVYPAQKSVTDG